MDERRIGDRLRSMRAQRGLSQRQLARQSGVANATISLIEAGKLNPTVGVLKKILDGIPVSLAEFFSDEAAVEEKIFFRAAELTEIADGGISYRQVGSNLDGRAIQLLKERYAPGADTGRHALTHDGEECGVLLKGCLEVTVGERREVLHAGDAYYFKSNSPHRFHNPGTEPCELVSACSPPSF